MATVEGLSGGTPPVNSAPARSVASRASPRPTPLVAPDPAFDPVAALVQVARGAASPPPVGLSAQLMDWATPNPRQFETVMPARLLPLLSQAVDRLGDDAHRFDDLGKLGALALHRELQDHQVLAERRATMIEP